MYFSQISSLAQQINARLDDGTARGITFRQVADAAENETVWALIEGGKFGRLDVSIYSDADKAEFSEKWLNLSSAVDAKRKFGVEKAGACLLLAWLIQMMQEIGKANEDRQPG